MSKQVISTERISKNQIVKRKAMKTKREQYFDYNLLLIIVFLVSFGLVMLYSASAYSARADFDNDMFYFSKQALISLISIGGMLVISCIDYRLYARFAYKMFVLSIILMALVLTPLGVEAYGARRWLPLPKGMTFQPSEFTKIAVIIFIAYELCRLGKRVYTREGTVRIFAFGAVAASGVLFMTDNLSTAVIVMGITCVMYFVVHPKTKPFIALITAAATIIGAALMIFVASMKSSTDFRMRRIITWLDPENHADTGGFQVLQGLYAIGSGGFWGKGLGNSTQKLGTIPEVQNDMILTVVCEELGVFGALVILILFGMLLYRLMFIAQNASDLFGSLIAIGIFAHISLQVILNIAVVTNMIPTTGITLPFISYGGTSIVFLMAEMGIALGISRRIKLLDEAEY